MKYERDYLLHAILLMVLFVTMLPFLFVLNNSLRTNIEIYHAFFGVPGTLKSAVKFSWYELTGQEERIQLKLPPAGEDENVEASRLETRVLPYGEAMRRLWQTLTKGYQYCWGYLRPYMLNSFFVCIVTAVGVIVVGSLSAYVLSRYRFPGSKVLFLVILSVMMIPPVLTLVPSFLLVRRLGLLNSHWVLILPYMAGGQVFAIYVFKSFFDGLPEELFESARIDGAGHLALYRHIVLPLSKPVIAVVAIVNILGTWNNFLWPFICNTDPKYHVVASGLFLMGQTQIATNLSAMYAAFSLSSLPLLVLFVYATKPFLRGVASGAFKA